MIAKVLVDSPLPHLDKDFDYEVPPALSGLQVGSRVRVPFAGRLISGVVHSLTEESAAGGLKSVKSAAAMPSYSQASFALAASICARYGGSLWDALRLMAPPRVAAVEKLDWEAFAAHVTPRHDFESGSDGDSEIQLERSRARRQLWCAAAHDGQLVPAEQLLKWIAPQSDTGSSILVVPDVRHIKAVLDAATELGLKRWTPRSGGEIAVLTTQDGPRLRYASYLAALRGVARIVVGTRQAAWQAVPHLEAIAVWEESHPGYAEPRSPYPHSRTVAALRSLDGAALLLAGRVLSAEALALESGDFASLVGVQSDLSHRARVTVVDSAARLAEGGRGKHWLPSAALNPLRQALIDGVAAVVVPQKGYGALWACARCHEIATCAHCGDDLYRDRPHDTLECRGCVRAYPAWHCAECTHAVAVPVGLGLDRVAQELQRTFADVAITTSSASQGVVPDGTVSRGLVVATPGALPSVNGGYDLVLVLGAMDGLDSGLGSELHNLRRLMHHASLAKGATAGGRVIVTGEPPVAIAQALVTWDPLTVAYADLEERRLANLPPHRRAAQLRGDQSDVAELIASLPTPHDTFTDSDGVWILASLQSMPAIVAELKKRIALRSAAGKSPVALHVDAPIGGARHAFARVR